MSWLSNLIDRWRRRPVTPVPPIVPPLPPTGNMAAALLEAHNAVRVERGLRAYRGHAVLNAVAQQQSDYQAKRDRIGHDGPGGASPWDRIQASGYRYEDASENVAAGFGALKTAKEAVQAWLQSTVGHRENVLDEDFIDLGGGMATAKNGNTYWTAVYATPGGAMRFIGIEGSVIKATAEGLTVNPRYEVA